MALPDDSAAPFKNGRHFRAKTVLLTGVALFLYAGAYGSSAVFAQKLTPYDDFRPLSNRILPEYTPNGYRTGSFTILPSFETGISYNDNIYSSNEDRQEDLIYTLGTGLSVESDFTRHALNARFDVDRGLYRTHAGEDYTDYNMLVDGRLDVTEDQTAIPFSLAYGQDHYDRSFEEERSGTEPTVFKLLEAVTGIVHDGQSIAAKAIFTLRDYVFDDTRNGGQVIDNSDRDRTEYSLYTSFGAEEEAMIAPFVYSDISRIAYKESSDNNGFNRSADEYEFGAGAIVNVSDITRVLFHAGNITRLPDDPDLERLNDFAFGMNVIWEPSPLATFYLDASRDFDETITEGSTAATLTRFRLAMDYELFPNVIVRPSAAYETRDYEGIALESQTFDTGVAIDYKLNQNVWLSSSYKYITRDEKNNLGTSPNNINDFDGNVYNLTLKLQF